MPMYPPLDLKTYRELNGTIRRIAKNHPRFKTKMFDRHCYYSLHKKIKEIDADLADLFYVGIRQNIKTHEQEYISIELTNLTPRERSAVKENFEEYIDNGITIIKVDKKYKNHKVWYFRIGRYNNLFMDLYSMGIYENYSHLEK